MPEKKQIKVGFVDDDFSTRKYRILDFDPSKQVLVQPMAISYPYPDPPEYFFEHITVIDKSQVKDIHTEEV